MREGVRQEIIRRKRLGLSIIVWEGGQVVEIPADEISEDGSIDEWRANHLPDPSPAPPVVGNVGVTSPRYTGPTWQSCHARGAAMSTDSASYVISACRENDVKFIRLWFTDILGSLKSFAITVEELEEALDEGMGFDGSSIEGFARIDESDMVAMPDPATFQLLPWRPREARRRAHVLRHLPPRRHAVRGRPALRAQAQQLKRAADLGYTFYVGPELEFFYFKDSDGTEPLDHGGYFDLTPLDVASDLRRETVLTLEEMGIGVEYSHHEVAPSQHEIDLRYTDALTMADNAMTYRLVVKEVALRHGVYATFMPKPLASQNGSGMHVHQSLFKGERTPSSTPTTRTTCRAVAKAYIAGLLHHAREITLVTNQWVNCYKRLVPGFEAPGLHDLGAPQPQRPRSACRSTSPARKCTRASSTARPTRPATPISRSR